MHVAAGESATVMRHPRWILFASLSWLVLDAPAVPAQARFEVLRHDPIARTPHVTVVTVRDTHTSKCYVLFTAAPESASAPAAKPVNPTLEEPPRRTRIQPPDPQQWATMPFATPSPGLPTGGWEQLAESIRLAFVHPSTAQALAAPLADVLARLDERLGRIEHLLVKSLEARSLAAVPVPCGSP
jgi:hypothetical protein